MTLGPLNAKPAENDLKAIQRDAAALGVALGLHLVLVDRRVDLNLIERRSGKKGNGALVMDRLCKCADVHSLTITLYAYEASRYLIDYYAGFGFIADPDGNDEADMVRFPENSPII